jgi:hypothetical protein
VQFAEEGSGLPGSICLDCRVVCVAVICSFSWSLQLGQLVVHRFKMSGGQGTYKQYTVSQTVLPMSASMRAVDMIETMRPWQHSTRYGGKQRGEFRGGIDRLNSCNEILLVCFMGDEACKPTL